MNSNLNRALSAALVAFGGAAPALAQYDTPGFCIDPTNTNPYSNDFNAYFLQTPLFGAGIGVSGTIAYGSQCGGGAAPVRGRIGFTVGPQGSIQDDLAGGAIGTDNYLRLTEGIGTGEMGPNPSISYPGPYFAPSTGGLSFARIFARNADGTLTDGNGYLYGGGAFNLAFIGRSGRYMYTEGSVNGNNIGVRCVIDVLGDAARVDWRLTNNTANPLGLGLWFGQAVALIDANGNLLGVPYSTPEGTYQNAYITVPGRKPLTVHERFPGDVATSVPPYVNFSGGQKNGFGLQVINDPSALAGFDPLSVLDQTSVDEFVLGEAPFVIDGRFGTADPTFGDFIFNAPGNGNADAAALDSVPVYLQKWQPNTFVGTGGTREIVAYYRPIGSDASYAPSFTGYSAVVDTPKAISTNPSDPSTFNPNPFTIRVNVDNTGGFSITDTPVRMQSVQVVLNLPAGMHAPNSTARTITKTITNVYDLNLAAGNKPSSTIDPGAMGYVDFQAVVDPTAFGALPYTVTITPQPGFSTKTITGTINVATTPRLLLRPGANLVSPPWQFADNSWGAILNLDLNTDFQSFTWDAQLQQYVPQTTAERARGSWILAKTDYGFRALGGSPQQPDDEFPDPTNFDVGGLATPVRLRRGWNLVGNPYNYAFPLGQLVGIPVNQNNAAYTYADLIRLGYTDGSFSTYDPDLHGYTSPIQGVDAKLQPNHGYWIYANVDFDLQFPPLYELFLRSADKSTTFNQRFDNWKLQLSAVTPNANDTQTYVGIARTPDVAKANTTRKAPMAPTSDAIRSYVSNGTAEMGQLLRNARGTQTFAYNVATRSAGPVTISWPNLRDIPTNLAVTVKDLATKKQINARSKAGYTFNAAAASVRSFQVTVTPRGTIAQRIGAVSATPVQMGSVKSMRVSFFTSARGSATIQVYKAGVSLGTIANDIDIVAGNNFLNWPMIDGEGRPLPAGTYTLVVSATSDGGRTAIRQYNVNVRR